MFFTAGHVILQAEYKVKAQASEATHSIGTVTVHIQMSPNRQQIL